MNELVTREKTPIGKGMGNLGKGPQTAFPYEKYADRVIKTRIGDIEFAKSKPELKNHLKMDKEELEMFQAHPEFFAKVYKITDRYAVVEKLDTDKYRKDAETLAQGIVRFIFTNPEYAKTNLPQTYVIDPQTVDPTDIEVSYLFWKLIQSNNKALLDALKKYCDKKIFEKFFYFFVNLKEAALPKKSLDIHDGNLGYNKEGELRLLDI